MSTTLSTPTTVPRVMDYAESSVMSAASSKRWLIAGMLFLAAVLNYIDRNLLGLLAPTIQADLQLTDAGYAHVVDLFLIAYTISYLFSGRVIDRVGARMGMALCIGVWSISNTLTGLARSAGTLGVFRFLLGIGEAGGWLASPKAVSEWFAPKERALAIGVYSLGSTIGATIAPFLVVLTASSFGWRGAFVLTGLLGIAWIVPWLLVARNSPGRSANASVPTTEGEARLWRSIVTRPAVWQLTLARLLTDAVWYFYLFWMPKYLHAAHGVSQQGLWVMAFVFLAADLGFLGGGFLSDRLVKRGANPAAGRVWLMLAAACVVPVSALVPFAHNIPVVLVCAALVALAHCTWLGNLSALVVDLSPPRTLATTFGLIGAGSAAGGILMNKLVVWAIESYSYDRVFFVMACLHPLALLLVWPLRRAAPPADR